jgi:hypothetical protein
MKTRRVSVAATTAVLALALAGCGPSKDELAARERARLEAEQHAEQDAAKGNKAITDMNKKMFGRMNASAPGTSAPATQPAQPAPEDKKP